MLCILLRLNWSNLMKKLLDVCLCAIMHVCMYVCMCVALGLQPNVQFQQTFTTNN